MSGAHALLTNIVLAWNTSRMDAVAVRLHRDGLGIEEDWLRRIGPAHFSHINFRGPFRFNVKRYADVLVERAVGGGAVKQRQRGRPNVWQCAACRQLGGQLTVTRDC